MSDYAKQIENLKECYRGLPDERHHTFLDMATIAETLLADLTAIRGATDEEIERMKTVKVRIPVAVVCGWSGGFWAM